MKSIKVLKNLESYMLGEWKAAGRGGGGIPKNCCAGYLVEGGLCIRTNGLRNGCRAERPDRDIIL